MMGFAFGLRLNVIARARGVSAAAAGRVAHHRPESRGVNAVRGGRRHAAGAHDVKRGDGAAGVGAKGGSSHAGIREVKVEEGRSDGEGG